MAFIAVLAIGAVSWLVGVGESTAMLLDIAPDVPLHHLLSSMAGWTSGSIAFLVFALVAFPYRAGHLVAIAIASINLLGWLLFTVMGLSSGFDLMFLLRLFHPLLVLTAAVLAPAGWAGVRSRGKGSLKLTAVCIAGAVVLLAGPVNSILSMFQFSTGGFAFGFLSSLGINLFYGLASTAIVVFAALDRTWSRLVAAGVAAVVVVLELARGVGSFFNDFSSISAPFILVDGLGMAAGATLLIIAARRTGKAGNALPHVASPPLQQPPQVANPYASWNPPHR